MKETISVIAGALYSVNRGEGVLSVKHPGEQDLLVINSRLYVGDRTFLLAVTKFLKTGESTIEVKGADCVETAKLRKAVQTYCAIKFGEDYPTSADDLTHEELVRIIVNSGVKLTG